MTGPDTFARRVFLVAGIWGLLIMVPQYVLEDRIGRLTPPPITHPEYFYGFVRNDRMAAGVPGDLA